MTLYKRVADLCTITFIMSTVTEKAQIIVDNRVHNKDTGSCEVQVALLSTRIRQLTDHLRIHAKDFHSRRGLIAMTNRRRKLLAYLKRTSVERYNALIQKLNLRK